jgi:hypothetical protein
MTLVLETFTCDVSSPMFPSQTFWRIWDNEKKEWYSLGMYASEEAGKKILHKILGTTPPEPISYRHFLPDGLRLRKIRNIKNINTRSYKIWGTKGTWLFT